MNVQIRQAVPADVPVLRELIDASVRGLQAQDYTPAQIELALKTVCDVDSQLIADGTYFVAEIKSAEKHNSVIAGCGGWSKRKTLFGGDRWTREKTRFSILPATPQKFAPSLSIPRGPGAASAA